MANSGRKITLDRTYYEDEYVQIWLTGLAEKTKRSYLFGIREYLDFVKMTPSEQIKLRIKQTVSEDLTVRVHFENVWRKYKEYLEAKGELSDSSIKTFLKIVASFFSRNSLPLRLKRGDWSLSTTQKVIVQKWIPTNQEVKRLYAHANLRDRSLLLALYQSGFSEIDVVSMRIEDLKGIYESVETEHYFIEKPREKTGQVQATCLSFECVHDLKAMLQERGNPTEGYLFESNSRNVGNHLTVRAVHEAMQTLAQKVFPEKTEEFKTKSLRSAYNSALLRASIQIEVKSIMMGHKRIGAREFYSYDKVTIEENYAKVFQYLTINGIQSKKDIEELRKTQYVQAKTIAQFVEENQKQKEQLDGLTKSYEKLENMVAQIASGKFPVYVTKPNNSKVVIVKAETTTKQEIVKKMLQKKTKEPEKSTTKKHRI